MNAITKMNEEKRVKDLSKMYAATPDFGTGSLLMRPEDTSIEGASEDFMGYLQDPTFDMVNGAENDAIMKSAASDRDTFDQLKGTNIPDLSQGLISESASQEKTTSKSPKTGGSGSGFTPPAAAPQEDILAQLKAARAANDASMLAARRSDDLTSFGNNIMKSGSKFAEALANRSGNTNIKLEALQTDPKEVDFTGTSNKSRLDALMQDYGIKKGIEDSKFAKDQAIQARKDRAQDKAEDRQFKLDMLKAKNDTKAPPVSDFDKALKRSVGNQSADWVTKDRSQIQNDIVKLKEVEAALQASVDGKGDNVSGSLLGRLPLQDFVNEKGYELQNTIDQVTQKNLKDILGGQFAQQEGQDLLKRGYDPKKDEAYNLKNVKALREAIEESSFRKDEAVRSFSEGDSVKDFVQNVQSVKRPSTSSQDDQAKEWATKNPNDPRAAAIFKRLGL